VFKEDEDSTKIDKLTLLSVSYFKIIIVVPLLSICTGLIFILFLYWYPSLRKKFFYSECTLDRASHLYIEGTSKYQANRIFIIIACVISDLFGFSETSRNRET